MALRISAYLKPVKVRYRKRPLHLFEMDGEQKWIRAWMRTYFSRASRNEHQKARNEAYRKSKELLKSWSRAAEKEFYRLFHRRMEVMDYKVSGIVRNEFSQAVKEKLRDINTKINQYQAIAYAHNRMLPASGRIDIHKL